MHVADGWVTRLVWKHKRSGGEFANAHYWRRRLHVLMSFFVSAVCGYMAGLIGSSNSPLSGIGILVVIGAALLLVLAVKPYVSPDAGKALMAFALFTTAVIFNVAAIANNNLQDL